MLFNSFEFIFGLLPLSLLLTYGVGRWSRVGAKIALLAVSLAFYAWSGPSQLTLLLASIFFNFAVVALTHRAQRAGRDGWVRALLIAGVASDLALLGWYKYANFAVQNVDDLTGIKYQLQQIALPLGISFFTFQKIAYLIDTARGETRPANLLDFSLFSAFYPQLIAGPIVRFREVMPQLQHRSFGRLIGRNLMVGLLLFAIGLFKKTVIADALGEYVNPLYASATHGQSLSLASAWAAGAGYTLQLYFDFSGYSDMAIGIARGLGIKLPLNFHSPLRAPSIIDYWRRWHMTLQRFIVSYIFQPMALPLNRLAANLRLDGWALFLFGMAVPVFVTFVLVGIWHGAGWTFAALGAMHGIYLSANEAWREFHGRRNRRLKREGRPVGPPKGWQIASAHALTVVAVIFSQVMFRSHSVSVATFIWRSMVGLGGLTSNAIDTYSRSFIATLVMAAGLVFLMPNSQQIMGRFDPALNWREWRHTAPAPFSWTWKPNLPGLMFAGLVLFLGIAFVQRGRAVFLYFNF